MCAPTVSITTRTIESAALSLAKEGGGRPAFEEIDLGYGDFSFERYRPRVLACFSLGIT